MGEFDMPAVAFWLSGLFIYFFGWLCGRRQERTDWLTTARSAQQGGSWSIKKDNEWWVVMPQEYFNKCFRHVDPFSLLAPRHHDEGGTKELP